MYSPRERVQVVKEDRRTLQALARIIDLDGGQNEGFMDEKAQEVTKEEVSGVETPVQDSNALIIESKGRKFDVSTEVGRAQLKGYMDAVSELTGRLSNEVGSTRKENALLKSKVNVIPKNELRAQQQALIDEGRVLEAIDLANEYAETVQMKVKQEMTEKELFEAYWDSRRDQLGSLDKDMAKSYIFTNYKDEMYEVPSIAEFFDSVLLPKVAKVAPKAPSVEKQTEVFTTAIANPGKAPEAKKEEKKDEKKASWNDTIKEFGF